MLAHCYQKLFEATDWFLIFGDVREIFIALSAKWTKTMNKDTMLQLRPVLMINNFYFYID